MIQLEKIVLYNSSHPPRIIDLDVGKLNIITGGNNTGKSALIEIVDYCFGSGNCRVPKGVIRNTVTWYLLKLKIEDSELLVGRKNPDKNKQSTNAAYLEYGKELKIPESIENPNSTIESVGNRLTDLIGIPPNLHEPPEGETRDSLSATFRHALKFCLQEQNEVANKDSLFHHQLDNWVRQSIKDTLPLFLGAVRADKISIKEEIRRLRSERKSIKKQLEEEEFLIGKGITKALTLLQEAQEVGLIKNIEYEKDASYYKKKLVHLLDWTPQDVSFSGGDELTSLQDRLATLEKEIKEKESEIKAVESYLQDYNGYSEEKGLQKRRLESIKLFEEIETNKYACPFCKNENSNEIESFDSIKENLLKLSNNLDHLEENRPKLEDHLDNLKEEKMILQQSFKQTRESIRDLINQRKETKEIENLNTRKAKVIGRISLWLESVDFKSIVPELEAEIKRLDQNIEKLQKEIDDEDEELRLEFYLNKLSDKITEFSKDLDLEYKNNSARLNLKKLTVVVDKINEYITLDEMGGGQNWLGYSLVTHLALHEIFINNNRPVPRFIIFDQLSQIYYPQDRDSELKGSTDKLITEDQIKLNRLFKFIYNFIDKHKPNFQVLLLDHADIQEKWFQDSVVERWRDGKALIPNSWIKS